MNTNNPNMMWTVADEIAKSIHEERVNGCPHEGWGGSVFDYGGNIVDARIENNELVIVIEFDEYSDHQQGRHEISLKPTGWKRSAPKKRKRQRAKDIRAKRK